MNESANPTRLGWDFTTKRTRLTADLITRKLITAEQLIVQGKTVVEVCHLIDVTQPSYQLRRQPHGGILTEEACRLTQLEIENARLKKLLSEAELEKAIHKDLAERNFLARNPSAAPSQLYRIVTGC